MTKTIFLCAAVLVSMLACKKGDGGGGGGGGGGGWLVGESGSMLNVRADGATRSYDPGSTAALNGIACRYTGEAWVVGDRGTLLYTDDAGDSWRHQAIPTTVDLRALGTQDHGPVYVAGDGAFFTSSDAGAHWAQVSDGATNFRSLAAAQDAADVLAVSEDGAVWAYDQGALEQRATFAGARAVAISPDGSVAVVAGDHLLARSADRGHTWTTLATTEAVRYDDVRVDAYGQAIAVGAGGVLAHIGSDGSIAMQHLGGPDLHTIHIAPLGEDYESIGYAAGASGTTWITHDGGWTWTQGPNAGQTVRGVDEIGDGHR